MEFNIDYALVKSMLAGLKIDNMNKYYILSNLCVTN